MEPKLDMSVRKLVVFDLTSADTDLFESYERKVLPILNKYKAELELSVRSVDGATETHVLYFPSAMSFEAFMSDASRAALKDELKRTRVKSTITDVKQVDYLNTS